MFLYKGVKSDLFKKKQTNKLFLTERNKYMKEKFVTIDFFHFYFIFKI